PWLVLPGMRSAGETESAVRKCSLAVIGEVSTPASRIQELSRMQHSAGHRKINREETCIDANHFRYLVLMNYDYLQFLDGDINLSVKHFSQAAFIEKDEPKLSFISAKKYFFEHSPKSHPLQWLKAKFACYYENEEYPSVLNLKSVPIYAKELLVPREVMLDLIKNEKKPNESLPPELTEHLQTWKSEFLCALNIAAYKLYSNINKKDLIDSKVKPSHIKTTIEKELSANNTKDQKTSLSATLLRHDHDQQKAKEYLKPIETEHYPHYFSHKLIYLNEKCRKYLDEYSLDEKSTRHTATSIERDLTGDGIIPENTARRIASEIKPKYHTL
ncbi:hypothetical protein ACPF7Z_17480, partial [Halomonas sp. GXIMD04776]|uniref:hypothetical protein n=1 Tax=Halomonas sp. GXIMD04776 TaxID=3415605 RepID=UPI003CB81BFF